MARKTPYWIAALLLVAGVSAMWVFQSAKILPLAEEVEPPPPDASYEVARTSMETSRQSLAARLTAATNETERKKILIEAHSVFTNGICRHLAPWWKNTPWDFNGTTQTPGQGKIACGYYVSTLLLHAGLQVERVRMAQQASLHIIQTLVGTDQLVKGHGIPLQQFVERIKARGMGLYVVGLDNHTGFLWHDGFEVWFLHSTVVGSRCVIKERASRSPVLDASRYRVAGYLSGNDSIMEIWLTGKNLPTKLPATAMTHLELLTDDVSAITNHS